MTRSLLGASVHPTRQAEVLNAGRVFLHCVAASVCDVVVLHKWSCLVARKKKEMMMMVKWCLMSSDVSLHIRDKL